MKKLLYPFIQLLFVSGITGCKKDFLEPKPLSFYEPSLTYVDAASMRAALVACAVSMRLEYYGGNPPILTEMLFSEITVEGITDKSGPAQDLNLQITPDLVMYNDDDHNKIFHYWNEAYKAIKYANTIISRVNSNSVKFSSVAERNTIMGAAYFYRAMRYYRLTQQFGDVPAVMNEVTEQKLDFYSTKREVILLKIKTDLDSALLWTSDAVNRGEVTKGAVAHLLIKVNLALGKFDEAIAAANSIINGNAYSLMKQPFGATKKNVIWDLHRPENKSLGENKEGIFMIIDRFGDGGFGTGMTIMRQAVPFWGTNINTPSGKKGTSDQLNVDLIQSNLYGRGIGRSRPSNYSQYEIWNDTADLRHHKGNWMTMEEILYNDGTLKTSGDPWYLQPVRLRNSSGGLLCTDTIRSYYGWPQYKIFIPDFENSPMQGGHSDWYVFRIAETYLLRAEAYFWKGDLANAAADIDSVKSRAGCKTSFITAAEVNMGTILDERARELFFEEPRKTELTRIAYLFASTGKAAENGKTYTPARFSDDNYFYDRVMAKNNFYKNGIVTNHGDKYTMSPYHVLWPVPSSSIQANSNGHINQNKGYTGFETNVPALTTIP